MIDLKALPVTVDDIMDAASERRGRPSTYHAHGRDALALGGGGRRHQVHGVHRRRRLRRRRTTRSLLVHLTGHRRAAGHRGAQAERRSVDGLDVHPHQGGGVAPSPASGDRVELSGDAALRAAALRAANETPAIRTELVEQMREKLNAGKIGNDAGALADAYGERMRPMRGL